jgi:hypothetical protein
MWHMDLPSGAIAAPLVVGGNVVVTSEDGSVRGFDGNTGALAWSAELTSDMTVTPTIAGGTLYAVGVDGVLRTMSLADRSMGWTATGFLPDTQTNVAGDLVFAGAPGAIVALGAGGWHGALACRRGGQRPDLRRFEDRLRERHRLRDPAGAWPDRRAPAWTLETASATVLTAGVTGGTVYVAARDVAGARNVIYRRRARRQGAVARRRCEHHRLGLRHRRSRVRLDRRAEDGRDRPRTDRTARSSGAASSQDT